MVGFVTLGGVKRIGVFTSYMVPLMSIFYIFAGIVVILMRITDIPAIFALLFLSGEVAAITKKYMSTH